MNPRTGRPLEADDLFRLQLISDPRPSPDGSTVAYVVTTLHREGDEYRSAIWSVPSAGGPPRQMTNGNARDTTPRWSPDGATLAFVSNRPMHHQPGPTGADAESNEDLGDQKAGGPAQTADRPLNQIWLLPVAGGEATQLTTAPYGASSPEWSPSGDWLAFLAPSDGDPDAAPMTDGGEADERIIRRIRYRVDGKGFLERFEHVWIVPVSGGSSRQVTYGDADDAQPTWSPDGQSILFVSNRRADRDRSAASTLYSVPLQGGDPRRLCADDASFAAPTFSPDGTHIAFTGHLDFRANGRTVALWTVPAAGGEAANRSQSFDRSLDDGGMSDVYVGSDIRPVWTDDNKVLALSSSSGATSIVEVDLTGGTVDPICDGPRRITAFAVTAQRRVVFTAGEGHRPFELFIADLDGSNERQLTDHNRSFSDDVQLGHLQAIDVSAPDGTAIQTWLLPPHGYDETSRVKHKLVLQIHGGPHAMYGHAMFHEMQLMAARGYAVLFCNPRGSVGYGEDFTTTTRGRWGEADMPDVMAAVDAALALGWVDEHRLGITGGSYGGYLTNWIIGHSDRFRAAVTQRCVSDFASFFGTSDIGYDFGMHEFGGVPWADAELLRKHSPITYVEAMRTPLLILHSERDLRCPIEQAEQLFTALKYLDRDVAFVRFPEESHDLSRSGKPSRRLARLHHLIGWFDAHL